MLEEYFSNNIDLDRGLLKPNGVISYTFCLPSPQAHQQLPLLPTSEAHGRPSLQGNPSEGQRCFTLANGSSIETTETNQHPEPIVDPFPITPPTVDGCLSDLQMNNPNAHQTNEIMQIAPYPLLIENISHISQMPLPESPNSPPLSSSQVMKRKAKGKRVATRRSQRLQDKQRPNCSPLKPPINPRSRMAKIPFDLKSPDTPLEENAVIQILHASGLQISQKVEELLQEAIKRDRSTDTNGSKPSTPLHDIVPPIIMPENGPLP